ncbi:DUF2642 domain-containing protein [Paenibacillus sp. NPDC057967]|uniref:DUF2642 domain-containing protein n=1 Tax=Paenibacillus sp. NPDC057967 TaxID=3346293 RepID=UPI0036D98C24
MNQQHYAQRPTGHHEQLAAAYPASLMARVASHLAPIVQPAFVGGMPAAGTPIQPAAAIPQAMQYVTSLDPVYVDHLGRHKGLAVSIMTTAGLLSGVLSGIAVDHIQLTLDNNRAVHIRIAQIVYFEGHPITYA